MVQGAHLKPLDFAGFSLTGTYQGLFLVDFDIASQFPLDAVMAESSGGDFPTFVRGDPQDRVIPLHIEIQGLATATQARIDDLKVAFSPSRPIAYLRVQDEDGNTRRMRAKSLGLVPWEGHDDWSYVASLHAPEPVWENDEAEGGTSTLTGTSVVSNQFTMDNRGNERTFPAFRITPKAQKSNNDGYIDHWPITIAWRSPYEGVDSLGGHYPIDITNRAWNTATLISGGDLLSNGDDVRVFVDGSEVERYLSFLNTTGTSVWCGVTFQPARTATLGENMGSTPVAGDTIVVNNEEGTAAFPESGILLIDNEAITYHGKTPAAFLDIKRGRRSTTAATHAIDSTIYWVEHDIRMITNYALEIDPHDLADREPMFDINFSSNLSHRYGSDGLIAPETLRPGQWLRERRSPHIGGDLIQMLASGSSVLVQDLEPAATKPNFDTVSLYIPVLGSVAYDVRVGHEFVLQQIVTDFEGFETLEIQTDTTQLQAPPKSYKAGVATFGTTGTVGTELSRLSLVGSIAKLTGSIPITTTAFLLNTAPLGAVAESFDLRAEDPILGAVFYASKSVGCDRDLGVGISLLTDTGPGPILFGTTIPAADIPNTTKTKFTVDFSGIVSVDDRRDVKLLPGTYVVQFVASGGTTGTISIYGAPGGAGDGSTYAGGSYWEYTTATGLWAEFPERDLAIFITSRLTNGQADTEFTTGENVAFRNPIVTLSSTYAPLIVVGSRQDGYVVEAELQNTDTDQTLTIFAPLIVNESRLKIDCDAHAVTVQYMSDDHEVDTLWAVEPDDIAEWIRLEPGVNTMAFDETPSLIEAGINVEIERRLRSRWT